LLGGAYLCFFDRNVSKNQKILIFPNIIVTFGKKGRRNRAKSLGVFMEKYKSEYAIRISPLRKNLTA